MPKSAGAVGLAVCIAQSGCADLLGADEYSNEPTPPATLGGVLSWLPETCLQCAAEICPELVASCEDDPLCMAVAQCVHEDPGPGQRVQCSAEHAPGGKTLFEIGRCIGRSCADACGGGRIWSCLGRRSPRLRPTTESFEYHLNFYEVLLQTPLPDLEVRACPKRGWSDPGCGVDVDAEGSTDPAGDVRLRIPFPSVSVIQPWDGFLTVTGDNYYSDIRYFNLPIVGDVSLNLSGALNSTVSALSAVTGLVSLPERGLLTLTIFDCSGLPAAGVSVTVEPSDAETRRFYSKGNLQFDESLTETGADGLVIFGNVPSGVARIRAEVAETTEPLPDVEVVIRPSWRTNVYLEPYFPE
jgi:hypothetical protein